MDIKHPNRKVWSFLRQFANKYDGAVFSLPKYRRADLDIPQFFIAPSIDPLSLKNKHLTDSQVHRILSKESISTDKPIITQVSRFDKWKDPLGVLNIFSKIKESVDAQLVLIGNMASDDPEGPKIYNRVVKKAQEMKDVKIITKSDDLLVNALQRASHVVLQNSIREGFGLTVSEALWKKTPVIGRRVGGIPLQIIHKKTGILADTPSEASKWAVKLIKDNKLRANIGAQGKEHIRKNFLITRHLYDYLKLMDYYTSTAADDIIKAAKKLKMLLHVDKLGKYLNFSGL